MRPIALFPSVGGIMYSVPWTYPCNSNVYFYMFSPRAIDVSEALELPGVVDVITAEDVPGDNNHNGEVLYAQNEVCDLYVA